MRQVKGKDTGPETEVRRLIHGLGYRYRLHRKDLPGKPDIVFSGRRKVIFVHGCFWHGHDCKRGSRLPKSNSDYWREKIARNRSRDTKHVKELQKQGWGVLVLWECQLRDKTQLRDKIIKYLEDD